MLHDSGSPCSLDLLSEANVVPGTRVFVILMT